MRRDEQLKVNDAVIKAYNTMDVEVSKEGMVFVSRLRTCTAKIYRTTNWYILESYNTVVAAIRIDTDCGFDFLRYVYGYTATSAQHISKFFKDFGKGTWGCEYTATFRDI